MIRLAVILAALLPVFAARANVYSVSNDVVTFTCTDRTLPVDLRYGFRFTVKAYQGATVIDLSNRVVRYKVFDLRDGISVQESEAAVDITNDTATASLTLTGIQPGQYEGKMLSYNTNDVLVATLSCDRLAVFSEAQSIAWTNTLLTVTNLGASGGGGGSTSVTVTNLIVSTNIISVTVTNTGGGGGGSGTLSGFNSATTGGVFLVVSNGWDASITNEGNVFTIYTGLPRGATGVNQVATWNGTNWIATALGAPTPTPTVGTNVVKFATVWGITNTWVAPTTQIMFTAWGAAGGGYSGGAGHSRALWIGSAGTIFDIIVGTGGRGATATNNGPFSGAGINAGTTNTYNGGGATYISISGTTNIILIASGGGGGQQLAPGGPGAGFWFGTADGFLQAANSNIVAGQGASASNEYGLAAIGGSNAVASLTNQMHVGAYLYGGHASTNGCTAGITAVLGGGGGGWYGGSGATRTNATVGTTASAGGGGGLGFANTNYVRFAQIIGGQRSATGGGVPAGQDHPTYTAGRGVGGTADTGASGCAGAMW